MSKSGINDALNRFRQIREGKTTAARAYEVKDESVLVSLGEDDYNALRRKRTRGRFIEAVDDEGTDYVDDGEEFWENGDLSDELEETLHADERTEERLRRKRKKRLNAPHIKASTVEGVSYNTPGVQRLDTLFLNSTRSQGGKSKFDSLGLKAIEALDAELDGQNDEELDSKETPLGVGEEVRRATDPHSKRELQPRKAGETNVLASLSPLDLIPGSTELNTGSGIPSSDEKDKTLQKLVGLPTSNGSSRPSESALKIIPASEEAESTVTGYTAHIPNTCKGTPPSNKKLWRLENGSFFFYFLDIHDDGKSVYLFGKVLLEDDRNAAESCCIVVKSVQRNVFVLPRDPLLSRVRAADGILGKEEATSVETTDGGCSSWQQAADAISAELAEVRKNLGIKKWMYRPVERTYPFDDPVIVKNAPMMFVKCVYSAGYPPLPSGLQGKTFSHIFGADTSLTELFLIKRRIMGPSWIIIENPDFKSFESQQRVSHCYFEAEISSPAHATPAGRATSSYYDPSLIPSPPPLRILGVCFQVCLAQDGLKQDQKKICMAGTVSLGCVRNLDALDEQQLLEKSNHITSQVFLCRPPGLGMWPLSWKQALAAGGAHLMESEERLIEALLQDIAEKDPDLLVGHSLLNGQLDLLGNRLRDLRVAQWSCVSRLKQSHAVLKRMGKRRTPGFGTTGGDRVLARTISIGRLLCDTELLSRDLLRSRATFDLTSLVNTLFPGHQCQPLVAPETLATYANNLSAFKEAAMACWTTARYSLALMAHLRMLPLTRELTLLAGHIWSRSLLNLRAERNEYLLLHRFHQHKLIKPDKRPARGSPGNRLEWVELDDGAEAQKDDDGAKSSKRKAGYVGGLVLEPQAGLYDRFVLLLDFNSLYPSIIQEYNVCFTTTALDSASEEISSVVSSKPGVLPSVLRGLVERRRQVKAALKRNPNGTGKNSKQSLEIRQLALKLTANSIYGCLGFGNSRFFARPIAAFITMKGREALQETKRRVETDLRLNVIYGDTDSIMVDTGLEDDGTGVAYAKALELGQQIKDMINRPGSHMELELDGVVDYAKKVMEHECKGLDIVRRDWCGMTKQLGDKVLQILFDPGAVVDTVVESLHALLKQTQDDLENNRFPLELFILTRGLSKMPHQYADAKTQPHVQVAKRLLEKGHTLHVGSEIQYVICTLPEGGASRSLADRAFSLEEVVEKQLKLDITWYKANQILPPIGRLCQHVAGTNMGRLAECLGLESGHYTDLKSQRTLAGVVQPDPSADDDEADATAMSSLPDGMTLEAVNQHYQKSLLHNSRQMVFCPVCKHANLPLNCISSLRCSACAEQIPYVLLHNWLQRLMHQLISSVYRFERKCVECGVGPTQRVALVSGSRCLQSNCPEPVQGLIPVVSFSDMHIALEHLQTIIYLLKRSCSLPEDQAISAQLQLVRLHYLFDTLKSYLD